MPVPCLNSSTSGAMRVSPSETNSILCGKEEPLTSWRHLQVVVKGIRLCTETLRTGGRILYSRQGKELIRLVHETKKYVDPGWIDDYRIGRKKSQKSAFFPHTRQALDMSPLHPVSQRTLL